LIFWKQHKCHVAHDIIAQYLQSINIVNETNYVHGINIHLGACFASNFMMYFKQIGFVFVYKHLSTMKCIVFSRLYEKVFLKKIEHFLACMFLHFCFSIFNNSFLRIRKIYNGHHIHVHVSLVTNITTLYISSQATCLWFSWRVCV
jgi:glycosyltransferase involved in cell wall biosynthesis